MISTPSIVNDEGNILIHNQEGARVSVFFETDAGVPRNMVGLTVAMIFNTDPATRVVLEDGAEPNEKVLALSPGQFMARLGKRTDFALRDESLPEMPAVWRGYMNVQGF